MRKFFTLLMVTLAMAFTIGTASALEIPTEVVQDFYTNFFNAHTDNDPKVFASFFADPIRIYKYAGDGPASRKRIEDDRAKFIKQFPQRCYAPVGGAKASISSEGFLLIEFSYNYTYDGVKPATGHSTVNIALQLVDDRLLIIAFTEKVRRL